MPDRNMTAVPYVADRGVRGCFLAVICLLVVTSCVADGGPDTSLRAFCTNTMEISNATQTGSGGELDVDLNALGGEEKQAILEAAEDAERLPELLRSFCQLGADDRLPGIEPDDTIIKLEVAHARREIRRSLEESVAPAVKERVCPELYWVNIGRGGHRILYFFCDENSGFSLVSVYRTQDGRKTRIELN